MHVCRRTALRATRWVAVLAVLALVAAAPARAGGDENYEGWYITLDAALTQPTGLEQAYGYSVDWFTGAIDRHVMDNDSDFTGALKFGYGFGDGGRLQVSYWGFDNEDEVDVTLLSGSYGYFAGSVFGYGYNFWAYPGWPVVVAAKSKVKAATFDVDYLRSYAVGEKTTVTWLAGLRSATFEETREMAALQTYWLDWILERKSIEADALGLRLGVAAKMDFTEHFGLEGDTTFSFLQASTEGKASMATSWGASGSMRGKDDNARGEIREFDLKACWSYGMMDYFIGYRMETWDGLVIDPIVLTYGSNVQARDSVSFNSLHAGVTFKFGND